MGCFIKYEAVNYPETGKEAFHQAICSAEYLDMLTAYGAFDDEKLIGIIATRNAGAHIAFFLFMAIIIDRELERRYLKRASSTM